MFGAGEFVETARPTGLKTLMQAVGQAPDPKIGPQASRHRLCARTRRSTSRPLASPRATANGQALPDEEWPEANRLDHKRLEQARKIDADHPPLNFKLNGFKPSKEKPRTQEL